MFIGRGGSRGCRLPRQSVLRQLAKAVEDRRNSKGPKQVTELGDVQSLRWHRAVRLDAGIHEEAEVGPRATLDVTS